MNRTLSARVLAMLLAVLMVIGMIPMTAGATEADSTVPAEETVPAETVMETTAPEETVPATTVPEETVPETTAPEKLESVVSRDDFCIPEGVQLMTVNGFVSETHDVFSHAESTIAPGVTQYINYAYAKDGKQMVYYVMVADVTRDDVVVQTSYKDQYVNGEFGMEKLTVQMAYADQLYTDETSDRYISEYYKVVGGVNASFYNMTTGQPSGVTYLDGVQIGESSSYAQFFAILKDGTAIIDYTKNLSNYEGNIWQAVAGSQMLVWNGADVTATVSGSYNTDRHSRTCVGVTADGKVVMMSLDGRQEPFSCGGTMHELAQIMLEAGCIAAINLDGGGSTTFAARQEGENEVTIVNRPSDGSERSISSGLIIGSLTVPSDVFDRATLTAEHEYVTPGSTVTVTAKGVSPAGTAAEIPGDVTWQLADSTMGSVENGIFVSNGTAGDVEVQLVYQGSVVGSTVIHVVVPDKIAFDTQTITVPYGKTVTLAMTATYGLNEVVLKASDVTITLSDDALGTIDGFAFTACEENETVTRGTVTVTMNADETVTATATINLGKGSEVVVDFEDGALPSGYKITTGYPQYGPKGSAKDENGNYYYNGQNELGEIYVVTAENGQVHDGSYAMAVECDFSQAYETGYHQLALNGLKLTVPANAQTIGMWIYIPELEELYTTSMRLCGSSEGSTTNDVSSPWLWDNCEPYGWDNDGWRYITMDISGYSKAITFNTIQFYICDRDNTDVGFTFKEHASVNGKFTYYIDSVTVDYSSAVDDRDAPVFSSVVYADEFTNDAPELNGQSTTSNKLSFTATVADHAADNATGVNAASVKAYIDGVAVSCTYAGGKIAIADEVLADGVHTIRFEASDNMGNLAYVERRITVNAGSDIPTLSIVPQNPDADKILIGSLYWIDLVAADASKVETATVTLNLNSVSQWELEHMVVAAGFEAAYSIDAITNNATITVTKTGNVASGTTVLVQMPIRTWESRLTEYEGYEASTPQNLWTRKIIWPMDIKLSAKYGSVTFTDGTNGSFSMDPIAVLTELYGNYGELNANGDYANKTSWHIHTAQAVEDVEATCTEDGYTGRTYCDVCASVVDWGTTIPATGHVFEEIDGILKCSCGDLFQGEKDGKLYVDGIAANGWIEDSYYAEGMKLTGIQFIDGYYYDLGEEGICAGQAKYTGLIQQEKGLSYAKLGELVTGWVLVGENDYYFGEDFLAVGGTDVRINGYVYSFDENFVLVKGMWTKDSQGRIRYVWADEPLTKMMREIEGKTYCFDNSGFLMTGDQYIKWTHGDPYTMYYITDEGVVLGKMEGFTGLHKSSAGIFMVENGEATYAGLVLHEGDYYYINSSRKAVTNTSYSISEAKTNGLLPAGRYDFGADGKMIDPPVPEEPDEPETEVKQGLIRDEDGEIRYYVDGVATYAGLVLHEGNYYYINSSKKAVKNTGYNIGASKTNGLLPAGRYYFDAEGKMIDPPTAEPDEPETQVKQGLIWDEDGEIRYYVDGVATYAGLVLHEGNYYYINSYKKAVKNTKYGIGEAKTNGLLPAGVYYFDAEGRMIDAPGTNPEEPETQVKQGLIWDEDGEIRYYVDGVATYAGLVLHEGDYYYINSYKKAVKNTAYGIGAAKTNGLLPAGRYTFGADGKMIDPPVANN